MQKVGGHKTVVYEKDGKTICVYHKTPVVTLNTGGWKTATTKARMNQMANEHGVSYRVAQEDHDWFVYARDKRIPFTADTITFNVITGEVID